MKIYSRALLMLVCVPVAMCGTVYADTIATIAISPTSIISITSSGSVSVQAVFTAGSRGIADLQNAANEAKALGLNVTFLDDIPGAVLNTTFAFGINDTGQVVGIYGELGVGYHGFLYSNGTYTKIDPPGATNTIAYGINNSGQIVGDSCSPCLIAGMDGFLYNRGAFGRIQVPGASQTFLSGINDLGQMIGGYRDGSGNSHSFLYSGGRFTTIDVPVFNVNAIGGLLGVNNLGQIVGIYYDAAGTQRGFLYNGGSFTTINIPGSYFTYASSINDLGQIAGTYGDTNGLHGFVYNRDGSFTSIEIPGDTFSVPGHPPQHSTTVVGINNRGEVLGQALTKIFIARIR